VKEKRRNFSVTRRPPGEDLQPESANRHKTLYVLYRIGVTSCHSTTWSFSLFPLISMIIITVFTVVSHEQICDPPFPVITGGLCALCCVSQRHWARDARHLSDREKIPACTLLVFLHSSRDAISALFFFSCLIVFVPNSSKGGRGRYFRYFPIQDRVGHLCKRRKNAERVA